MARTALSVQSVNYNGATLSFSAGDATNGHEFVNDGKTLLQVKNTNAATRNVTILSAITVDGLTVQDPVVTIPATTGDKMIGPFPPKIFNQAGGLVYVDLSASAGVTLAAFKLT